MNEEKPKDIFETSAREQNVEFLKTEARKQLVGKLTALPGNVIPQFRANYVPYSDIDAFEINLDEGELATQMPALEELVSDWNLDENQLLLGSPLLVELKTGVKKEECFLLLDYGDASATVN